MRLVFRVFIVLLLLALLAIGGWMALSVLTSGEPDGPAPAENREQSPYFTAEDRLVDAAGMTWRVRESGPADAPAIILLHGFAHSLEDFEPWADRLERDHRVIRFDLPGHGLTGPREDGAYSVADTVDQVEALLEEVAPADFTIAGNSLGGLVAWRYAADNPGRVDAVVLLAPGGYSINGVTEDPVDPPLPVRLYLQNAPQAGVNAATAALFGDPDQAPEGMTARIGDLMREPGVGDALVERIRQFTLPDPNADLARIEAPVLIIWGAEDPMIPAEHAERFSAALEARHEIVLLDGVGHLPQLEAPDETVEAVRAFLSGLER